MTGTGLGDGSAKDVPGKRAPSPATRRTAATRAVAIEYQRRLNFTSRMGLNTKAQKPGETITAVRHGLSIPVLSVRGKK